MDQTNQTNGRVDKKPVLFSISSYSVSIVIIFFFLIIFFSLIDVYNKSKSDLSRLLLKKVIVKIPRRDVSLINNTKSTIVITISGEKHTGD